MKVSKEEFNEVINEVGCFFDDYTTKSGRVVRKFLHSKTKKAVGVIINWETYLLYPKYAFRVIKKRSAKT